ncbi:DinB family protein [Pseudothauera rhizosphaerae]|uniref:Damage-inducible protein DinB n=1 Tax=Pseudothauera rhizosphaerae TaxID=2565932 RepID=A0A4S4AQT9_9RHOO|nr:DinB family protein [Pseudothauera rhizosphaerae]THF62130.1 hypothetical protein E6O51_08215 [Pseudothauera rhizosphaerae]
MATDWRSHFIRQTDYQLWANQVLFDSLARLQPEALEAQEGLFFGSIHHTVDHLLVVLRLWAAQLRGESPAVDFHRIGEPRWTELKHGLQHELRHFRHWLAQRQQAEFDGMVRYTRSGGEVHHATLADILTHLMNHFTHHRGQISAVATRLGAPAAEMDFIYFVRDMERAAREAQQQAQQ